MLRWSLYFYGMNQYYYITSTMERLTRHAQLCGGGLKHQPLNSEYGLLCRLTNFFDYCVALYIWAKI